MKYDFSLISESNICNPDIELFWIKLSLKCARPTYICCLYRPPDGSSKNFVEKLENQMETIIDNPANDLIIMGDVNIDMNKWDNNSRTLHNFTIKHSLTQIITKPTRITETTSSVIDHIYVNNTELYVHCGTLEPGLSDHSMVFVCRKQAKISKEKKSITVRNYRNFDPIKFGNDIVNTDWSNVYNAKNVDEAVLNFNHIFTGIINLHLPYKRIRVRIKSAPWITHEFFSLLNMRKYKGKCYKKCPCELHLNEKKKLKGLFSV